MCFLVVFLAVMPGIISSAPCLFVPDLDLNCVQYLQDDHIGCLDTIQPLQVTGLRREIEGDIWISVQRVIQIHNNIYVVV
jgi:hypothetical protein